MSSVVIAVMPAGLDLQGGEAMHLQEGWKLVGLMLVFAKVPHAGEQEIMACWGPTFLEAPWLETPPRQDCLVEVQQVERMAEVVVVQSAWEVDFLAATLPTLVRGYLAAHGLARLLPPPHRLASSSIHVIKKSSCGCLSFLQPGRQVDLMSQQR